MRTDLLVVQNINELLNRRNLSQRSLARWVGHHETWISKILKHERGLDLGDIDKIADFFGITGYQLLSPGISMLTERRRGDRRSGRERRSNGERRRNPQIVEHFNKARAR